MTHLADLTSEPVRGRRVHGQDEWLNRSECTGTLHNHSRRFTCVSSKNNFCCHAILGHRACTSSIELALPASSLHFQHRACTSSIELALPASSLHFQHRACTSSTAALPAPLHCQLWIQNAATTFQDRLSLGRTVTRRKHRLPSSMLLKIMSLMDN